MRAVVDHTMPKIVCLCGSTRFHNAFAHAAMLETIHGNIVLTIGATAASDSAFFGALTKEKYDTLKSRLDALHKRKIELADEVYILNYDGYIGESTASEVAHAMVLKRHIRWAQVDAYGAPVIDEESVKRLASAKKRRDIKE